MKKTIVAIIACILAISIFAGCQKTDTMRFKITTGDMIYVILDNTTGLNLSSDNGSEFAISDDTGVISTGRFITADGYEAYKLDGQEDVSFKNFSIHDLTSFYFEGKNETGQMEYKYYIKVSPRTAVEIKSTVSADIARAVIGKLNFELDTK